MKYSNPKRGFSLVEILIVVAIVGVLSSALIVTQRGSTAQSRDAERKADLRNLKTAIELYKNEHGRYPLGCNSAGSWSGQIGTDYECADGSRVYIRGIAEYIPTLPDDPKLNGTNSGYVYTTNAAGTVFKIMAKNTVEVENVNKSSEFKSCDVTDSGDGICDEVHRGSYGQSAPNHCYEPSAGFMGADLDTDKDTQFDNSYGLWGGWAETTVSPDNTNYYRFIERYTEDIICDIP